MYDMRILFGKNTWLVLAPWSNFVVFCLTTIQFIYNETLFLTILQIYS